MSYKKLINSIRANSDIIAGRKDPNAPEMAVFETLLGSDEEGWREYMVIVVPKDLTPDQVREAIAKNEKETKTTDGEEG